MIAGGSQLNSSRRDDNGTKGSFAMTSMLSSSSHSDSPSNLPKKFGKQPARHEMNEAMFRPDHAANSSNIVHPPPSRSQDADSIGSDDSTMMIIRKDTTWVVSEDARTNSQAGGMYNIPNTGSRTSK